MNLWEYRTHKPQVNDFGSELNGMKYLLIVIEKRYSDLRKTG